MSAKQHQICHKNKWDICITAGSLWQLEFKMSHDKLGQEIVDLSDITFTAGIKYRARDTAYIANMTVEQVTHPEGFNVLVTIPASESAKMQRNGIYAIQMQSSVSEPITIMFGDVTVSRGSLS